MDPEDLKALLLARRAKKEEPKKEEPKKEKPKAPKAPKVEEPEPPKEFTFVMDDRVWGEKKKDPSDEILRRLTKIEGELVGLFSCQTLLTERVTKLEGEEAPDAIIEPGAVRAALDAALVEVGLGDWARQRPHQIDSLARHLYDLL